MKTIFILLCLSSATRTFAGQGTSDTTQTTYNDNLPPVYREESINLSYRDNNPYAHIPMKKAVGYMGLQLIMSPYQGQKAYGFLQDWGINYTRNLAMGYSISYTTSAISQDFGYTVAEPRLHHFDFSIFNEIMPVQWHNFSLGARLSTGLSIFELADNAIQEETSWVDAEGNLQEGTAAKTIKINYFLRVAPEAVIRYYPTVRLAVEAGVGYNFYAFQARFGSRPDFQDYQVHLGLKVVL